jgi:hypothetical protein
MVLLPHRANHLPSLNDPIRSRSRLRAGDVRAINAKRTSIDVSQCPLLGVKRTSP